MRVNDDTGAYFSSFLVLQLKATAKAEKTALMGSQSITVAFLMLVMISAAVAIIAITSTAIEEHECRY